MNMDEALDVLERDRALHLTQPCSEHDLDALEEALGRRLPADYRALLVRVGGGILYDRHELFGGRRLMVHDIELVPDVLSVRRMLEAKGGATASRIPLHRCAGELHLLDLSGGSDQTRVVGADGRVWRDLPAFLESVVLPARTTTAEPACESSSR
jgi:hypothetical protein